MQTLENKIAASKKAYSGALKKLEVLNTEIHRRRQSQQYLHRLDPRKIVSTGNSPEPMRARLDFRDRERGGSGSFIGRAGASDTESVSSLQLGDLKDQFSGSTGSLPSIGASSVEPSPSPTPEPPSADEDDPIMIRRGSQEACVGDKHGKEEQSNVEPATVDQKAVFADSVETVANRLVQQTLTTVVSRLKEEQGTANPPPLVPNS
jgi:hypothetical protein